MKAAAAAASSATSDSDDLAQLRPNIHRSCAMLLCITHTARVSAHCVRFSRVAVAPPLNAPEDTLICYQHAHCAHSGGAARSALQLPAAFTSRAPAAHTSIEPLSLKLGGSSALATLLSSSCSPFARRSQVAPWEPPCARAGLGTRGRLPREHETHTREKEKQQTVRAFYYHHLIIIIIIIIMRVAVNN